MNGRTALAGALTLVILSGCAEAPSVGDDTATPTPTPMSVSLASISAGGYHTCAIDTDGTASCWGLGDYEQLGTGSAEMRAEPASVIAPEGVTFAAVAAGNAHTCAIDADGGVWCWGVDLDGGDEADLNATHGPERVTFPDGTRITAIDGYYHSCAIAEDGDAWCWGRGSEGQLGNAATADAPDPVRVVRPDGVTFVAIATGAFTTCALDDAGSVWCWGRDVGDAPTAVALPGEAVATAITAGFGHACVLDEGGAAWCWGDGADGQLGDRGAASADRPVAVAMPDGVTFSAIDAGNAHTCAVATDGAVWCWGLGIQGGATDGASATEPVAVTLEGAAAAVSAGGFHTCALLADGGARCWGDDSVGQLGDGTSGGTSAPVRVTGS